MSTVLVRMDDVEIIDNIKIGKQPVHSKKFRYTEADWTYSNEKSRTPKYNISVCAQ